MESLFVSFNDPKRLEKGHLYNKLQVALRNSSVVSQNFEQVLTFVKQWAGGGGGRYKPRIRAFSQSHEKKWSVNELLKAQGPMDKDPSGFFSHLQSDNPPKDWFIVHTAWQPMWGRKKVGDKGSEKRGEGAPLARNMSRRSWLDRFPQWSTMIRSKGKLALLIGETRQQQCSLFFAFTLPHTHTKSCHQDS